MSKNDNGGSSGEEIGNHECGKCGKPVRIVLEEYDYIICNIDSDSLHECFTNERSRK